MCLIGSRGYGLEDGMPLSQTISDTDCIMRNYNQLTAAGSYGERMILNGNQYKLNLTLSLTKFNFQARNAGGGGRLEAFSLHP